MNLTGITVLAVQGVLTVFVGIMSVWSRMPWPVTGGLAVLGVGTAMLGIGAGRYSPERRCLVAAAAGWFCTVVVLVCAAAIGSAILDTFYVVMSWLVAILLATGLARVPAGKLRAAWKTLIAAWVLSGCLIWPAAGYVENRPGPFYVGLLLNLLFLIGIRIWFRLPAAGILSVHTLILLVVFLPAVDLFVRPNYRLAGDPEDAQKYYSYDAWKKDPRAFAYWWGHSQWQWSLLTRDIYMRDPDGILLHRLRPNSRGTFFQSRVEINSRGFRGKEISAEKGNRYRILVLGESTTFGVTLNADDRPWPEVLERLITRRFGSDRPVEVINAGVSGYDLKDNLHRLKVELLALDLDMIVSYHGYNGFRWIHDAVPPVYGKDLPIYKKRPLKLLADCEYRLKMIRYKQRQTESLSVRPSSLVPPMETESANAYRELIAMARTNGIRLVLADYAMAVNERSDSDVIDFYRDVFPAIHWQIRINDVHSSIVKQLAEEWPQVGFVDTRSVLDGKYDKFIDVMHFTQEGRDDLAETVFRGIEPLLEEDLGRPASMTARDDPAVE